MKPFPRLVLRSTLQLAAVAAFVATAPAAAQHQHSADAHDGAHQHEHAAGTEGEAAACACGEDPCTCGEGCGCAHCSAAAKDETGHVCGADCPHHAEGHACDADCPHAAEGHVCGAECPHHAKDGASGEAAACSCGEGPCACGEGCGCAHCSAAAQGDQEAHPEHQGHDHQGHEHQGHDPGAHGAAADPHAAHKAMMAAPAGEDEAQPVESLAIPDVPVLTQDGREVSFYSDLVAGRTVAMNFIFTTCTTICPPMGANFGRLQDELGERLGRDVHLISVSVDPATDTPQRLKAWSEKFGARAGWTLVTGEVGQVEHLLKALQVFTPSVADHAPVALIGNDAAGVWTRAYGLAGPKKLAAILDEVAGADGSAGAAAEGTR